jgi:beta-lactamase regulating signal transducer with metallopeptidase domain
LKHFLLSFSLISLLLIPLLSFFTTGWETKWLPFWQTPENLSFAYNENLINKDLLLHTDDITDAASINGALISEFDQRKRLDKKGVFSNTTNLKAFLGKSLITIWALGLLFLLSRIFLGLYGAHKLRQQGKHISGSIWKLLLQRFLSIISIKRKISLLSHDKVKTPLTWGVFKPTVLVPEEARNWNEEQCSTALLHELSHIKRSDFIIKILARFSCSLYWFNPLSWFAFKLMKREQEKACDELVLRAGVKPSAYAASLLSIQKSGQIQWDPPAAVLGAVGRSQLNERLQAILKQQLDPKEVQMKTKILLSFFAIAAIAFIGLARPAQSAASSAAVITESAPVIEEIQTTIQTEKTQEEQEKKQEKKKTEKAEKKETEEEQEKKEITWVSKDGKTHKIIIFIGKDEEGNTITLKEKPYVIVKKGDPEKKIIVKLDGKDIEVLKGEEGEWTVEADKIEVIKEGEDFKVIKLDKGNVYRVKVKKGEEGEDILILGNKDVQLKEGKPVNIKEIHLEMGKPVEIKKVHLKKAKPLDVHMITIEREEGEQKKIYVSPNIAFHADPHVEVHPDIHIEVQHEKLKEKIKEIQEKLKKIKAIKNEAEKAALKEEVLMELEKALEGLQKELEESKKFKDIKLNIVTDIKDKLKARIMSSEEFKESEKFKAIELKIGTKIEDKIKAKMKSAEAFAWVEKDQAHVDVEGDTKTITVFHDDDVFNVLIKSKLDGQNKAKYEEILKQLKSELPEGYKAESEIDEEDNTITIKITFEKEGEEPKESIKELVQKIVDKIKKIEGKSVEKK